MLENIEDFKKYTYDTLQKIDSAMEEVKLLINTYENNMSIKNYQESLEGLKALSKLYECLHVQKDRICDFWQEFESEFTKPYRAYDYSAINVYENELLSLSNATSRQVVNILKDAHNTQSAYERCRDFGIEKNIVNECIHNADILSNVYRYAANELESQAIAFDACDRDIAMSFERSFVSSKSQNSIFQKTEQQEENGSQPPKMDSVQFSAIIPKKAQTDRYLPVDIIMYEDTYRDIVDEILAGSDTPNKEVRGGYRDVERNSRVKVVLSSKDVLVEEDEEERIWNGKYIDFEFAVMIPADYNKSQILLTASIYINDVIGTKLKMIVDCINPQKEAIHVSREDIYSAFVSYASQDRGRVAAIIQGMQKARPDLDIFFDVESLRSGQKWEKTLREEIDKRDILFLCWSKYAKVSEWVDMEWRYALQRKGEDFIEPIPIDSPDVCPPPTELHQKHFNDRMLFIIKSMPDFRL